MCTFLILEKSRYTLKSSHFRLWQSATLFIAMLVFSWLDPTLHISSYFENIDFSVTFVISKINTCNISFVSDYIQTQLHASHSLQCGMIATLHHRCLWYTIYEFTSAMLAWFNSLHPRCHADTNCTQQNIYVSDNKEWAPCSHCYQTIYPVHVYSDSLVDTKQFNIFLISAQHL